KSLRANSSTSEGRAPTDSRTNFDPAPRQHRQFRQLTDFTQTLLPDAAAERQAYFWSRLDTSSPEKFQKSIQPARDYFWEEIIGKLPAPTLPPNARSSRGRA